MNFSMEGKWQSIARVPKSSNDVLIAWTETHTHTWFFVQFKLKRRIADDKCIHQLEKCIKYSRNSRVCCYDGCQFVSSLILFCIITKYKVQQHIIPLNSFFSLCYSYTGREWVSNAFILSRGRNKRKKNTNSRKTLFPKRNVLFLIPIIALKCTHTHTRVLGAREMGKARARKWALCVPRNICATFVYVVSDDAVHTHVQRRRRRRGRGRRRRMENAFSVRQINVFFVVSFRFFFSSFFCSFECECVPRSNQNDKRSSHRLSRGAHGAAEIPALFFCVASSSQLYFRCISCGCLCVWERRERTRPFFSLIGVGQIEWNHPLNGIFRQIRLCACV